MAYMNGLNKYVLVDLGQTVQSNPSKDDVGPRGYSSSHVKSENVWVGRSL